jgi:hypothetical protein
MPDYRNAAKEAEKDLIKLIDEHERQHLENIQPLYRKLAWLRGLTDDHKIIVDLNTTKLSKEIIGKLTEQSI